MHRRWFPGSWHGRGWLRRGWGTSVVLAWALVLAPRPGLAGAAAEQPGAEDPADEQVKRAMAAYERGTQSYNLAQYEAALADFTEAASLYASPDFQYNIGLCYEKLGKYDEAIRAFSTYLRAKPEAEDRPNVENRIQTLQAELERRKREAEAQATSPAVTEPRPQPRSRSRSPSRASPSRPTSLRPPPGGRCSSPALRSRAWVWRWGSAAASRSGVAARKRSAAVDEVQGEGNPDDLSFDETRALDRSGRRLEGAQIGLAAGGAVVAVTGAVLLALGLRKRQGARPQAWLGPTTAGLVITSRF
jgi:tetratricopeptide (TPR) repeat protein